MTKPAITLFIIAKQPVPARVKTRLVPPCTHQQAAALAEAALADTLPTVRQTLASRRVLVLDGEPGPWRPAAGLRVCDLPVLRDVDTASDAVAVARQVPRSRFAARARELATVLNTPGTGELAGTGAGVIGQNAPVRALRGTA